MTFTNKFKILVTWISSSVKNYNEGNINQVNKKFVGSKKYGIYFTDEKAKIWIMSNAVGNKIKFGFGFKGINQDIDTLLVTDVSTILRIRDGYALIKNPKTGDKSKVVYTYFDALADGSIKFSGDGSTNDVKILMDIFKQNPNILKDILK